MTHNPSKGKSIPISIRVSPEEHDCIKQIAQENKQTTSQYVRGQALQDTSAAKRAVARDVIPTLSRLADTVRLVKDSDIRRQLIQKEKELWQSIK